MSKLYLTATMDMLKKAVTARANHKIETEMGYDPDNYSKQIKVVLSRRLRKDSDALILTVKDGKQELLICTGTIEKGIMECSPFSFAGPYPKLKMKR